MPQLVITGSVSTQAQSSWASSRSSASTSLNSTTRLSKFFGAAGIHIVVRAQFELTVRTDMRQGLVEAAVVALVHRQDFWASGQGAADADDVSVGSRLRSLRPARAADRSGGPAPHRCRAHLSVGIMVVIPCRTCFATASAVACGNTPNIAPVSPRQKSTYSLPSISVTPIAAGFTDKNRVRSSPIPHPRHRNAVEQHLLSLVESLFLIFGCASRTGLSSLARKPASCSSVMRR